ncbi:hypothetical protein [Pedobacter hiemivivus]|uniref:Uncharacterized protein n=1 Tax=Pedobacter hiemivivus TaxID=2530454 RepID=A0A4R0NH65_9SPHI|nr:hypothetical protein [Pedobacter hiemivivus]TCC99538.1 hypothetical protein EZ444_02355 [Pedobacter hiemivivus]
MSSIEKTFCNTNIRHLRLLFLVDHNIESKLLIGIMLNNYQLWGGRYNPIIPVYNGQLNIYYTNLLPLFDPDMVYYSKEIGLERVKEICSPLNPRKLIELDENGRNNLQGVYSHHLIANAQRQALRLFRPFSLVYFNQHEEYLQTSFYNLSFGIGNEYIEDAEHISEIKKTVLDATDIAQTNLHIAKERPFFNCLLSQLEADFTLLRPTNDWELSCLELIIYDEQNATDDLVYFWNRALSQKPSAEILQLIASKKQLELLITDPNFGHLLHSLTYGKAIYLQSFTLSHVHFQECLSKLNATYPSLIFLTHSMLSCPRISNGEFYPYRRLVKKKKNVLLGKKEFLNTPAPAFTINRTIQTGHYVYDVEFFQELENKINYIKFPKGTPPFFILGVADSRVNKLHHTSFFLNPEISGVDVEVPTAINIINVRIGQREAYGEIIEAPVRRLRPSDAGLKLASFIKLFDGSIGDCQSLLLERFWVDLILGISTGKNRKTFFFNRTVNTEAAETNEEFTVKMGASNIHNNDGTFSYLDLKTERRLIYLENVQSVRQLLERSDVELNDDKLLMFIEKSVEKDFMESIDFDLQTFVNMDALFIGMKVKCHHCGSNEWYPLSDLNHKMSCKGCLQSVVPAVQSHLYYRFNDVIYNNLSSDPVKRAKQFNGNYIVLLTLGYFSLRQGAYESFAWAPSMDILVRSGDHWMATDIDIAMIADGMLIIGEAKASGSDFKAKQFEQLTLMADAIRPDKLIIAYYQGTINQSRIQKLKEHVASYGGTVIVHKVEEASYMFGRFM